MNKCIRRWETRAASSGLLALSFPGHCQSRKRLRVRPRWPGSRACDRSAYVRGVAGDVQAIDLNVVDGSLRTRIIAAAGRGYWVRPGAARILPGSKARAGPWRGLSHPLVAARPP